MKFAALISAAATVARVFAAVDDAVPEANKASVFVDWEVARLRIDNDQKSQFSIFVENRGKEAVELKEMVAVFRTPKKGKVYLNVSEKLVLQDLAPGASDVLSFDRVMSLPVDEYELEIVVRGAGPDDFEAGTDRVRLRAYDPAVYPWHLSFLLALLVFAAFFGVIGALCYEFVPGFAEWLLTQKERVLPAPKAKVQQAAAKVKASDPDEWVPDRLKQRKR